MDNNALNTKPSDAKKELARFIVEQVKNQRLAKDKAAEFLAELSKQNSDKADTQSEDIAVIGIACQFPDASNARQFWNNLVNAHNAIDDFPDQRRAHLAALDNNETELFKGGFLSSVDEFDNEYFNIPPNVARHMDPYQRLLMQSLVEAIEDAGYCKSQVYGKDIGIFVGNDHTHRFFNNYVSFIDDIDFNSVSGSWTAVLASRLSYLFNLKGPALVIDTACSSGLVALDSAIKAIQCGDCESALVSAANLFFAPGKGLVGEIENEDFMVRAFDQGASGTVWGEGIASVLLKPLSQAKQDRDSIYGVIKGVAINNDGASNGLTAPNAKAQEDAIKHAWRKAKVDPESISYIETHGTGTHLGDPIEIKGLVNAFRSVTKKKQFCGIGSVKTNIGHTVGVAGLASLIKVLLSFRHKQLPPSINFQTPNPFIDFTSSPVYINDSLSEWSCDDSLTAGISSFSLSGTNCHLVVQEPPTMVETADTFSLPALLLPLSARSQDLLAKTIAQYIEFLNSNHSISLPNFCYTAAVGREHHTIRSVIICQDRESMVGQLEQLLFCVQQSQRIDSQCLKYFPEGSSNQAADKGNPATRGETVVAANRGDLNACLQLSEFYLAGANIRWDELYNGHGCSRVNVPGQVFKSNKFWDKAPGYLAASDENRQRQNTSNQSAESPLTLTSIFDGITEDGEAIVVSDSLNYKQSMRLVAYIWSQVLGYKKIQLKDDFYALGGDSITATKIIHVLNQVTEINCQLSELLSYPELSAYVDYLNQEYNLEKKLHVALGASGAESRDDLTITKVASADRYALSRAQMRMFLLQQIDQRSVAYNVTSVIRLAEMPSIDETNRVLNQIIERHETLRSRFVIDGDQFYQIVENKIDFEVEVVTISPTDARDKIAVENAIRTFIRPYDLSQAPLFRVGFVQVDEQRECFMVLDMHHIITDGSSMGVLISEYLSLQAGERLPELEIQYKDFAAWQNAAFEQGAYQQQKDFWLNTFSDELPVLNLQTDFVRPVEQSTKGAREFFSLDVELTQALVSMAQQQGTTLFMLLLAAFKTMLFRLGAGHDLVVGTPVAGRSQYKLHSLIGMFVNTLCLRNQIDAKESFTEVLQRVKQNTLAAFSNQDYPYEELIEDLNVTRQNGRNPLFDIYFALQNADMGLDQAGEAELMPIESGTAKFDMTIIMRKTSGRLDVEWEYMPCLYKPETVKRIFQYFEETLKSISSDAGQKIADVNCFRQYEKQQILQKYNQTGTDYPKQESVVTLFERHVKKSPNAAAVIFQGQIASYAELNHKANKLAHYLLNELQISARSPVALLFEPSVDMIVAILAVLKIGCYYVPLDTSNPIDRSRDILAQIGGCFLLTDAQSADVEPILPDTMSEHTQIQVVQTRELNLADFPTHNLGTRVTGDDLIYMMFTSGTTGKPKGTLIRHSSVSRVVCQTNYLDLDDKDVGLLLSNYAFDGCVPAIYGALLNGGSFVLTTDAERKDLHSIARLIETHQVSHFFVTTALFNLIVDNILTSLSSVKRLCFGGEAASIEHTKRALKVLGPNRILNVYGPTESTVFATQYPINHTDDISISVPIGKAISNTKLFVLDERQQPVAHEIPGELYIGGDGVAQGYFKQPELTSEKFMPSPYCDGEIYRTGDIVKWDERGNLIFLGRRDNQVKIRGYRIELSEIENCITQYEFTKDAFVCVITEGDNAQMVVAYVVAGTEIDGFKQQLSYYLNQRLPSYMQPSVIMLLDELPLNMNGKVDRGALPDLVFEQAEIVPPRTEQELLLVRMWQEMLSIDKVSIYDNFFALGGDSVQAIQLATRLKERGYGIESAQIFQLPSLVELARELQSCEEFDQASINTPQRQQELAINKIQQEELDDIFSELGIE